MEDGGRTGRTADVQRGRPGRLAGLADSQASVRSAVGLRQTCMTHVNTQLHLRHSAPTVPLLYQTYHCTYRHSFSMLNGACVEVFILRG